jgi:hypothetical protein
VAQWVSPVAVQLSDCRHTRGIDASDFVAGVSKKEMPPNDKRLPRIQKARVEIGLSQI